MITFLLAIIAIVLLYMAGFWSWVLEIIFTAFHTEKINGLQNCSACNVILTKYELGKHILNSAVQEKLALQEEPIITEMLHLMFSLKMKHIKLIENENRKFLKDEEVARGFFYRKNEKELDVVSKKTDDQKNDSWEIPKWLRKKQPRNKNKST